VDRRFEGGGAAALAVDLGSGLALSFGHFVLSAWVFATAMPVPGGVSPRSPTENVIPGVVFRLLLYFYAVLGGRYLLAVERAREAERHRAALTQARLDRLRSQLDPHFLFNVLNGIHTLVPDDPDQARDMIRSVARLLRDGIDEQRDLVPLEEEMDRLRRYLELQEKRYGNRLRVTVSADGAPPSVLVPYLFLQPLIENAVEHGMVEERVLDLRVTVSAGPSELVAEVEDDGAGLDGSGDGGAAERVGLGNLRARLELLYGDDALLAMSERPEGGVRVRVSLPMDAHAGREPNG
jgi:two-component system LytT family sensor kinase